MALLTSSVLHTVIGHLPTGQTPAGAAQTRGLIPVPPDGPDTVVGDRRYRLPGGEKQRMPCPGCY